MVRGALVTLPEAAALLGIRADTLRRQVALGKLHATKKGRDWHVTRAEVERYRAEHRRHGAITI
jgi:excisionase family DNA binding protein